MTYLRKYCSPALLLARNFGLNLDMTLLGGKTGTAASKLGKVCIRRLRRSSKSEYLLFKKKYEPCTR